MTKKTIVVAALSAVALLGQDSHFQQPGWMAAGGTAPAAFHAQPNHEGQSGPVVGRPFSGTESRHSVQILSDGTRVEHTDTGLYYRDDRGRMRSESSTHAMIYDPVAGLMYTLDLKDKSYRKQDVRSGSTVTIAATSNGTSFNSHTGTGKPAASKGAQPVTEELPGQMMNGIYVKGERVTSAIPAGTFGNDREVKVVSERWYSDDLKVLVKSSNSDPRFGTTTYELMNIVQSLPDAGLFQVPAEFRVGGH
jgi:hypothetical protein